MKSGDVQTSGSDSGTNPVVQRNVDDILAARRQIEEQQSRSQRFAGSITRAAGSVWFAYFHVLWFAAWIALNSRWGGQSFDPFPCVLLTTIVSLEAIFLTLMVLVSQNREAQLEEQRADLDLQIDLLAEHEITRLLSVVNAIARKVGVIVEEQEMKELEKDVRPRDLIDNLEETECAMPNRRTT
jgi:uncharacterized membrane protein